VAAVIAAGCGLGYWSLVLRPIVTAFVVVVGAWIVCRWRPGLPVLDSEVKAIVVFGFHVVGFTAAYTLTRAVDRIVLAFFYRADQVGYYQNAMNLYDNSIATANNQTHNVVSTALSRLQFNPRALREKYEIALSVLSFFLMPASALLSVCGEDLAVTLLGEKWHAAGALLSILALRGLFNSIEESQGWVHLSLGTVDRWRKWGFFALVVQIAAVLCGLPFGPRGVAAGVVAACACLSLPSIAYAGRSVGIDVALVLRATGRQMFGSIIALTATWWFQASALGNYLGYERILISSLLFSSIYLALVVGLFRLTEPFKIGMNTIRELVGT